MILELRKLRTLIRLLLQMVLEIRLELLVVLLPGLMLGIRFLQPLMGIKLVQLVLNWCLLN